MRSQTNIPCYFADVYHSTFDPPTDSSVVQRLVPDSKSSEKVMIERLMEYHRLLALQYITLPRNSLLSLHVFNLYDFLQAYWWYPGVLREDLQINQRWSTKSRRLFTRYTWMNAAVSFSGIPEYSLIWGCLFSVLAHNILSFSVEKQQSSILKPFWRNQRHIK